MKVHHEPWCRAREENGHLFSENLFLEKKSTLLRNKEVRDVQMGVAELWVPHLQQDRSRLGVEGSRGTQ